MPNTTSEHTFVNTPDRRAANALKDGLFARRSAPMRRRRSRLIHQRKRKRVRTTCFTPPPSLRRITPPKTAEVVMQTGDKEALILGFAKSSLLLTAADKNVEFIMHAGTISSKAGFGAERGDVRGRARDLTTCRPAVLFLRHAHRLRFLVGQYRSIFEHEVGP